MEKNFLTLASALTFASLLSFNAYAGMDLETDNAVSGMAVALNNYKASSISPKTALEDSLKAATTKTIEIQVINDARTKLINEVVKYEPPSIKDKLKGNIAVANVDKETAVLASADDNGKAVGSITYSSVATVLETVVNESGEWYKINSGNVDGYVKSSKVAVGEEANRIVNESLITLATVVDISNVRLRTDPEVTSETLTMLEEGERYVVIGNDDDFVKVQVDDDLVGYVYKDFVVTDISYKTAKTNEEVTVEALERDKIKQQSDDAMSLYQNIIIADSDNASTTKDALFIEEDSNINSSTTGEAQIAKSPGENKEVAYETVDIIPSKSGEYRNETLPTSEEIKGPGANNYNSDFVPETPARETVKPPGTERVFIEETTRKIVEDTVPSNTLTKTSESIIEKGTTAYASRETIGKAAETKKSKAPETPAATGESGGPGVNKSNPTKETTKATVEKASRSAIVAYAKQFVGNPYVYGGTSLTNGADCSGFTMRVYENFGINIGRTTRQQAKNGKEIPISEVQLGDLIFYASGKEISHVGIYIGDGKIVHAANSKRGIIISSQNYRSPVKAVTFLK